MDDILLLILIIITPKSHKHFLSSVVLSFFQNAINVDNFVHMMVPVTICVIRTGVNHSRLRRGIWTRSMTMVRLFCLITKKVRVYLYISKHSVCIQCRLKSLVKR